MTSLLDLPDEPRRPLRGIPAAVIGAAAWTVIGVVLARTFALGGYVRPALVVGLVVAVPATLIAWALAGPHPRRVVATAAVMLGATAFLPIASAGATPSPERLAQVADHYSLPGELVRERLIGSGRCRPACSEVRRTTVVRGSSFVKVSSTLAAVMRKSGFAVQVYGHKAGEPQRIDAVSDKYHASFELRADGLDVTRIAQVWIARGPKSDFEVG